MGTGAAGFVPAQHTPDPAYETVDALRRKQEDEAGWRQGPTVIAPSECGSARASALAEILTSLEEIQKFVAVMHEPQSQVSQFTSGRVFQFQVGPNFFCSRLFHQLQNGPPTSPPGHLPSPYSWFRASVPATSCRRIRDFDVPSKTMTQPAVRFEYSDSCIFPQKVLLRIRGHGQGWDLRNDTSPGKRG